MRKTIVAAAALAAVLSLGASADRAAAMTAATPTELGLATADGGVVEKAALVCNRWGCRRVWWGHRAWWGPRRRVYAIAGGQSVAVAVPSEWQEAGKPQALAAGSVLRFLDESGRPVEITAAALERAAAKRAVLRPEDLRKIALAAR